MVYECQCEICQSEAEHPDKVFHLSINQIMEQFDEQHRRWFAGLLSLQIGHGGDAQLARITGAFRHTISRGRKEICSGLENYSPDRIRSPGAGRPPIEKKA